MLAAAAKTKAEFDFANARTQQEAERAEQAVKDTTSFYKDVMRVKVGMLSDDRHICFHHENVHVDPAGNSRVAQHSSVMAGPEAAQ